MSKSKDQKSDQNLLKIAETINIDKDDLKAIKRTRKLQKIQYWHVAIFTFLLGFLGGWEFISSKDDVSNIGYPISQILIGINFTSHIRTSRTKKFFILGTGLILIVFAGFISGGTLGTFFHPTFNIIDQSASYYGVYSNQGA